ncbi:MAG: hypothetical protein IJH37_10130 [Clostridia bacterium]|nr:hypothetical protein [Clostridia bacterium]
MKKLTGLVAVLLAVTIPAGCGSKIKKNNTVPTAEAIEVTSMPKATQTESTSAPAVSEQTGETKNNKAADSAGDKEQNNKADASTSDQKQENVAKLGKAAAEKLVIDATGATGLKLVAEGDAYVFDCYQGNDYMGTVEVNATTGELIFQ